MSEREMATDEIDYWLKYADDHPDSMAAKVKARLTASEERASLAERERDEARRELEKTRSALIAMIRVVEKCQTIFNEKTIRSTISVGVSTGWIWDEEMHVARQLIANYESPKPAKELGAATTSDDTSWLAKYGDDREIVRAYVDAHFPDGWAHDKDVIDGFAPLVHQVRLEAVRKPTQSDRECARKIFEDDNAISPERYPIPFRDTTNRISAHVAASVAPVQKRLDRAIDFIEQALLIVNHAGIECTGFKEDVRAFLTSMPW